MITGGLFGGNAALVAYQVAGPDGTVLLSGRCLDLKQSDPISGVSQVIVTFTDTTTGVSISKGLPLNPPSDVNNFVFRDELFIPLPDTSGA